MRIQNIVLIEDLTISFHAGLQVLTGETGAGKSIVVDAVGLILGGRADRSLIRSGCEKAAVEAVFDVPCRQDIEDILKRESIEYDGRTVTIWREMTVSGRNMCRICGVIVSVSLLRELGKLLMDIHGQHEHQFLMDPEMHLQFLDRTGDAEYDDQLDKTARACGDFLNVHRRYARLRRENDQKQRRMEDLEEALHELHDARLKPGEEETLKAESLRLRNSEKIRSALTEARTNLSLSETEKSAIDKVRLAAGALSTQAAYDDRIRSLSERCQSAYYELEEIAYELTGLLEKGDADPLKLEKTEARLDLIRRLERRYGETLEKVLEEQRLMEKEYEQLAGLEDELEETAQEHRRLLAAYRGEARRMSEMRHSLAKAFEEKMIAQLADLGMGKTRFQILFQEQEDGKKPMPRAIGDDHLEFMISPNPGEPMKPLGKIASGGELSRLMLAMKVLETEKSGVDCMVFDEIDTGISGKMAQTVAEKMLAISRFRQVICVTHLPQIAAAADHQLLIAKTVKDARTSTSVTELDRDGRVREVARMISGAEGSAEDARAYARKMIEASEKARSC